MNEENVGKYTEYALSMIEENPETLQKAIQQNNLDIGVPNYVASLMSKIDGITGEEVIVVAMSVLNAIDKMILESGQQVSKEQRLDLITKTIKRVLEVNPEIAEEVQAMASEYKEPEDTKEQQQLTEEEQGVF